MSKQHAAYIAKKQYAVDTIDALGVHTVKHFRFLDAAEAYVAKWDYPGLNHVIRSL